MLLRWSLFVWVVLSFCPLSHGEETKAENRTLIKALKQKEYKEVEAVTDAELRAKAGSQSKWSLSGHLGYSGPKVGALHEDVRAPHPESLAQMPYTSMSGNLGVRYRWSSSTSITADTGLRFFTPFSHPREGEFNDPGVSLERLYPLWGVQIRSRYSFSATTSEYFQDQGQIGTFNMAHDFKRRIGLGPVLWSVGSSFNWFVYSRGFHQGDARVSNLHFSVYPGLQYNILDNLQLGTSLAFAYSNLREDQELVDWTRRLWSQRLSLGYGLTRNAFLSPYLNFFPEKFSWDTTSFNMNLYLNIF